MAEHTNLSKFASDPEMVKKVYDKVCYLRRKEKQKILLPSKKPEPSLSRTETWVNNITEVESASGVTNYQPKAKWNKPDEKYAEKVFGKYSVRPSKEELKSLFHSNTGLKNIINGNDGDFECCYNKGKYIFKKRGTNKQRRRKGHVCSQLTSFELWTVLKLQAPQKNRLFKARNRENCLNMFTVIYK